MAISVTEVAFAPTSLGVALAPTEGGGRGAADPGVSECDPTWFCVACAVNLRPNTQPKQERSCKNKRSRALRVSRKFQEDINFVAFRVSCKFH